MKHIMYSQNNQACHESYPILDCLPAVEFVMCAQIDKRFTVNSVLSDRYCPDISECQLPLQYPIPGKRKSSNTMRICSSNWRWSVRIRWLNIFLATSSLPREHDRYDIIRDFHTSLRQKPLIVNRQCHCQYSNRSCVRLTIRSHFYWRWCSTTSLDWFAIALKANRRTPEFIKADLATWTMQVRCEISINTTFVLLSGSVFSVMPNRTTSVSISDKSPLARTSFSSKS